MSSLIMLPRARELRRAARCRPPDRAQRASRWSTNRSPNSAALTLGAWPRSRSTRLRTISGIGAPSTTLVVTRARGERCGPDDLLDLLEPAGALRLLAD